MNKFSASPGNTPLPWAPASIGWKFNRDEERAHGTTLARVRIRNPFWV